MPMNIEMTPLSSTYQLLNFPKQHSLRKNETVRGTEEANHSKSIIKTDDPPSTLANTDF